MLKLQWYKYFTSLIWITNLSYIIIRFVLVAMIICNYVLCDFLLAEYSWSSFSVIMVHLLFCFTFAYYRKVEVHNSSLNLGLTLSAIIVYLCLINRLSYTLLYSSIGNYYFGFSNGHVWNVWSIEFWKIIWSAGQKQSWPKIYCVQYFQLVTTRMQFRFCSFYLGRRLRFPKPLSNLERQIN